MVLSPCWRRVTWVQSKAGESRKLRANLWVNFICLWIYQQFQLVEPGRDQKFSEQSGPEHSASCVSFMAVHCKTIWNCSSCFLDGIISTHKSFNRDEKSGTIKSGFLHSLCRNQSSSWLQFQGTMFMETTPKPSSSESSHWYVVSSESWLPRHSNPGVKLDVCNCFILLQPQPLARTVCSSGPDCADNLDTGTDVMTYLY